MIDSSSSAHDWRRNQIAVTVATFIGFMSFTLVMPFLPLYFELLGLHDTRAIALWSGLSLGITPAVTAMMAPAWARVANRYGRKLMVVRALFSFVVVMGLMSVVRHPWQVFALRAALGFFAGYGAIAMTMAAESAPPEHLAAAIGWVQTAQRLGPALGPVIGGILAQTVGLREAFLVAAGFYLIAVVFVMVGYREGAVTVHPDVSSAVGETWRSLRRVPHVVLFMGLIFGLQLVDRSFGPVLPLYLREIGTPGARVPFLAGVILTVSAGVAAIGNQICGWLLTRVGPIALVMSASGLAAAAACVFGLEPPPWGLVVAAGVFGFGLGVGFTAVYTVAGRDVPTRTRGLIFGYLTTASLSGMAVSPVIASLISSFSMRTVFFADAAGLGALAWIVRRKMVRV